jgi:hypothetical protein
MDATDRDATRTNIIIPKLLRKNVILDFKNIRFSEAHPSRYMQLRLEGFNVWNHVNFSGYKLSTNTVVTTTTSGFTNDTKTIMNNYSNAIAIDPSLVRATGCTGAGGLI